MALQAMQQVASIVMGPSSLIPPAARGGLWSDATLTQLSALAAAYDAAMPAQQGGGDSCSGSDSAAVLAGQASLELLLALATQPEQGLVRGVSILDAPLGSSGPPLPPAAAATALGVEGGGGRDGGGGRSGGRDGAGLPEGVKRLLRLLARLRPATHALHAQLLRSMADVQPGVVSELLGTTTWALEPEVSVEWWWWCVVCGRVTLI